VRLGCGLLLAAGGGWRGCCWGWGGERQGLRGLAKCAGSWELVSGVRTLRAWSVLVALAQCTLCRVPSARVPASGTGHFGPLLCVGRIPWPPQEISGEEAQARTRFFWA
jgi:hypothetical protein